MPLILLDKYAKPWRRGAVAPRQMMWRGAACGEQRISDPFLPFLFNRCATRWHGRRVSRVQQSPDPLPPNGRRIDLCSVPSCHCTMEDLIWSWPLRNVGVWWGAAGKHYLRIGARQVGQLQLAPVSCHGLTKPVWTVRFDRSNRFGPVSIWAGAKPV